MYQQNKDKPFLYRALRVVRFVVLVPLYRLFRQGLKATAIWFFVRGRLILTGMPTLRYTQVLPNLHVGGQIRAAGWEHLKSIGVTSIVNMRREHDDRAAGIDVPLEHYLHLPTTDDNPVSLEDLKRGADWVEAQIAGGGSVYIHCAAGSGRAPSMGAAYLIAHQGQTAAQALDTIRRVRPFIMPMPEQVERLREFERWIRNGKTE
jgi:protein-tyrosine phosphatase